MRHLGLRERIAETKSLANTSPPRITHFHATPGSSFPLSNDLRCEGAILMQSISDCRQIAANLSAASASSHGKTCRDPPRRSETNRPVWPRSVAEEDTKPKLRHCPERSNPSSTALT